MYFDVLAAGTLCEGAQVTIEGVKPKLSCENAGNFLNGNGFPSPARSAAGVETRRKQGKNFI